MTAPNPRDPVYILIRTKMQRPRAAGDLIPRPHLLAHLDHGGERKLILISTPAGYGKTTLLLQWLDTIEVRPPPIENREGTDQKRVAWLSIDQGDGDQGVFLRSFVAAIRGAYPKACPATKDLLGGSQQASRDHLVATLTNDLDWRWWET